VIRKRRKRPNVIAIEQMPHRENGNKDLNPSRLGVQAQEPFDTVTPRPRQHQPLAAAQHHLEISVTGGMELGNAIELHDRDRWMRTNRSGSSCFSIAASVSRSRNSFVPTCNGADDAIILWSEPDDVRCVISQYDETRYQLRWLRDNGTIKSDLFFRSLARARGLARMAAKHAPLPSQRRP